MELQQLRYFAIAAKYQHITRAANELHVAQPAVSGTIKRLENELGVSLFEKNGRNISLTHEGELFYDKIKKILNELDHLPEVLRNEKNRRENTVKINVRAASLLLTEAIISYKKKFSDVVIELTRESGNESSDITVTTSLPETASPKDSFCVEEEIFVAMRKEEAEKYPDGIAMTELKDKKLLSVDKSRSFYYICEKYCENAGFFPNIVFECDSTRAIEDLVSAGFGVCFHPAFSWGKPSGRDIAFVPIRGKFRRKIVVTLYDSEKDGVKKHFFDFLTNYIKNQMTAR